jgi:hypothetical protein
MRWQKSNTMPIVGEIVPFVRRPDRPAGAITKPPFNRSRPSGAARQ